MCIQESAGCAYLTSLMLTSSYCLAYRWNLPWSRHHSMVVPGCPRPKKLIHMPCSAWLVSWSLWDGNRGKLRLGGVYNPIIPRLCLVSTVQYRWTCVNEFLYFVCLHSLYIYKFVYDVFWGFADIANHSPRSKANPNECFQIVTTLLGKEGLEIIKGNKILLVTILAVCKYEYYTSTNVRIKKSMGSSPFVLPSRFCFCPGWWRRWSARILEQSGFCTATWG